MSVYLTDAQEPKAAAIGLQPELKTGIGLAYLDFDVAPSARKRLLGLTSEMSLDLSPKVGVETEVGYLRASNVFGTGRHSDILTYLAGPIWYPTRRGFQPYVHGLVGLARVTGPFPVGPLANEELAHGTANKLAWELGTGVEFRLHGPMRVRIGADYLHSAYFGPLLQIRGQSSVRMTATIEYVFGIHRDR
jgi:opacity protein-like surface antigen